MKLKPHKTLKVECQICEGKGYTFDRTNQKETMRPVAPTKTYCEKCNGTGFKPVYQEVVENEED